MFHPVSSSTQLLQDPQTPDPADWIAVMPQRCPPGPPGPSAEIAPWPQRCPPPWRRAPRRPRSSPPAPPWPQRWFSRHDLIRSRSKIHSTLLFSSWSSGSVQSIVTKAGDESRVGACWVVTGRGFAGENDSLTCQPQCALDTHFRRAHCQILRTGAATVVWRCGGLLLSPHLQCPVARPSNCHNRI